MTIDGFSQKQRLLQGYELLLKNPAYTELLALFRRHYDEALAGLRNRSASREKRDEYLQAAEDAEELLGFAEARLRALAIEIEAARGGIEDGE